MRKDPYLLQIGKKIKETRLSNNQKIREIAEKEKVSKGLVSKIENGRTFPSLPVLISLINSLFVNLSDFFHGIEPIVSTDFVHTKEQNFSLLEKEKSKGFVYHHIHNLDFRSPQTF